jgi:hypothetical protein
MKPKKHRVAAALLITTAAFAVQPAAAAWSAPTGERAARSNGVGVCLSQVAIDPTIIGVTHLGEAIHSIAGPGTPGSDAPASLEDLRNTCGEPPGPGHLR